MNRSALGNLLLVTPLAALACAQPAVTGAGAGGSPGAGGGTVPVGGALPCDVSDVLVARCQACHGTQTLFGAPMSLMTYANTQAPASSNPSLKVWQMMQMRVHASGSVQMPPAGYPPLSSAQLATLDGWFAATAPPGTGTCGGGGAGGGMPPTGAGGGAGISGAGGAVATGGAGGTLVTAPLPCTPSHTLTAHAVGSTAKYPVPNPSNDSYVCFNFKSPFKPGEQATAFGPIVDDARVIHHWLLYGTQSTNVTDGSIQTGCVTPTVSSSDTLVAGWAPGGQNVVLDPDVGMVLDYANFQLQIHYNNHQYADAADASGVAFCTTNTPRQNAAGQVELGSMFFTIPGNANDYPVKGTCSNLATDNKTTMYVLYTTPHMHLLGTGFTTQHMRGAMDMGDLSNVPLGTWSFENQRHYLAAPRRAVQPGDVLTTTCYYDNPSPNSVGFGVKTTDEMCFDFITVYPYALANKKCGSLL